MYNPYVKMLKGADGLVYFGRLCVRNKFVGRRLIVGRIKGHIGMGGRGLKFCKARFEILSRLLPVGT
jgi:hypothetical protein